jgi:alkanesulfonate monooxygenase SsuD/methylene tetrahydromethanopterin reductase-like flavin-dependent oxidoreductase (luciferase family)
MGRAPVIPEFWLFLPQLRMSFGKIISRAQDAERAGFDGVALIDHLAPPGLPEAAMYDAMTTAAAIVASTGRLRVTHLVLCGPFRHPALLAKEAVSLDHLSGGRFELGIGWGSAPEEFTRFGVPLEDSATRAARLAECLEIVRRLLSAGTVDYDGRFYRLRRAVQNPQPLHGRIAVTVGGAGPRLTMPLVREFADWWNLPSYAAGRLDELRPLAGPARLSVQLPVGLVPSPAAREQVVSAARRRFGGWGGLITGITSEITDALAAYVARGVERFFIQFSDFGEPATLEAFAREVAQPLQDASVRIVRHN